MKRLKIIPILLTVVFLFGCSGGSGTIIPSNENTHYPKKLEITASSSFMNTDGTIDEDSIAEWEDYMSDLYGFDISLDSYSVTDNSMSYIYNDIVSGKKTGMVALFPSSILKLIKENKILPLEEYLTDNKVWSSLPEDYRKSFEYEGHIWAIPSNLSYRLHVTSVRNDWLEAVGKNMPTNKTELMEAAKVIAEVNRDGSNHFLLGNYMLQSADILASFGIYVNYKNTMPIAYDPTKGKIVDAMFKPQAEQALQYLKTMLQKGIADPLSLTDPSTATSNAGSGLYGSVFGYVTTGKYGAGITWAKNNAQAVLGHTLDLNNTADYAFATSLYDALPPLSTEYPVSYTCDWNAYVLPKTTADPKATVNAFVDITLGSKKGFLDCFLGTPSHYTDKGNDVYVFNETGNSKATYPNIISTGSLVFSNEYAFLMNGNYSEQSVRQYKETKAYISNYIDKYTKTGQLVRVPVLYDVVSDTYDTYGSSIYNSYNRLLLSLLNDDISVETALTEYRTAVESYEIETILKEANTNLGLPVS